MRFWMFCPLTAFAWNAQAQAQAPRETATATIGGKEVIVQYGRPALDRRSVDELLKNLPEDRIWRRGSDHITTFTTGTDLLIGGNRVPEGNTLSTFTAPPREMTRSS